MYYHIFYMAAGDMNVGVTRVPRSHFYARTGWTCRTVDEGGPLRIGLQEQVLSHRKLLR
jgi:hypothetical protein